MVAIPGSPGIIKRPTTIVGNAAPSIQQTQIIPRAIQGLGQNIEQAALQEMAVERREQEAFDAAQILDYKNKLRRFDNEQKIKLAESPSDERTINQSRKTILEERGNFANGLIQNFGDNQRLKDLATRHADTSGVDLEFAVDRDLASKKREYGRNKIFENVSDLRDLASQASSAEDFSRVGRDLNEVLSVGLASGLINQQDIERQEKEFKALRKAREQELQNVATFNAVMEGSIVLDPSSGDDQAIVNDRYSKLVASGADPVNTAETIAIKTGIIPRQMKQVWSGQLAAGSAFQKLQAAEAIGLMVKENRSLESKFSSQEMALVTEINLNNSAGIDKEKIVKFAEENIRKNKDQEAQVRQGRFNQEFGSTYNSAKRIEALGEIEKELIKENSSFFSFDKDPVVPEQMQTQYLTLAKNYYMNEGVSLEAAQEMAKDKILGEWAITNIGERRYQKHAPERYYGANGVNNSKWIEKEAIDIIQKKIPSMDRKAIKKSLRLEVVPNTIGSNKPQYFATMKDESGRFDFMRGEDNLPIVYQPNFQESEPYKLAMEARNALRITEEKAADFRARNKARNQWAQVGFGPIELPKTRLSKK